MNSFLLGKINNAENVKLNNAEIWYENASIVLKLTDGITVNLEQEGFKKIAQLGINWNPAPETKEIVNQFLNVSPQVPVSTQIPSQAMELPSQDLSNYNTSLPKANKKSAKKKVVIIVVSIVLSLLLLIGGGIWFAFSQVKKGIESVGNSISESANQYNENNSSGEEKISFSDESAKKTINEYLDAFKTKDYATMYSLTYESGHYASAADLQEKIEQAGITLKDYVEINNHIYLDEASKNSEAYYVDYSSGYNIEYDSNYLKNEKMHLILVWNHTTDKYSIINGDLPIDFKAMNKEISKESTVREKDKIIAKATIKNIVIYPYAIFIQYDYKDNHKYKPIIRSVNGDKSITFNGIALDDISGKFSNGGSTDKMQEPLNATNENIIGKKDFYYENNKLWDFITLEETNSIKLQLPYQVSGLMNSTGLLGIIDIDF